MEALSWNTIEAIQMMLRLVQEVLDPVDMVSGFQKFLRVINALMSEMRDIQSIIAHKSICYTHIYLLSSGQHNKHDLQLSEYATKYALLLKMMYNAIVASPPQKLRG